MELRILENGVLQFDNVRLAHRNFEGRRTDFNEAGKRNFSVIIDDPQIADVLAREGWNVKIRAPKVEGERPFMYLSVKVDFGGRGPAVYLRTGDTVNKLNEETVGCLDKIDIIHANLDVRPYDWSRPGASGRSAYLNAIEVHQNLDRFARGFNTEDCPF